MRLDRPLFSMVENKAKYGAATAMVTVMAMDTATVPIQTAMRKERPAKNG
jgi:hypothetical protein